MTENGKILRPSKGYFGDIKWTPLATYVTKIGYEDAVLIDCIGNRRHKYVHRLVAECYHGSPPDGKEIHHIDGNRLNNRADNLQWVTHVENQKHRDAKIFDPEFRMIIADWLLKGETVSKIADDLGVSKGTILRIAHENGIVKEQKRLTKDQRERILSLHSQFNMRPAQIAKVFNSSTQTICAVIRRGKPKRN